VKTAGPRAGDVVQLRCVRLDERGAAVGETAGCEVHVAGALPGEPVNAVIEHVSPHAAGVTRCWARLTEVLAASAERVAPICPAYGPCGGCPLQHLAYPAQLRWKTEQARSALAREPTLVGVPIADCVASPRTLGYRNQGKYVYGRTAQGRPVLGAYAPRSHVVVDLAGCAVVEPAVDQVAGCLRQLLEAQDVIPFDEQQRTGDLRYAVIRASAAEEVLVTLVAARAWDGAGLVAKALRAADARVCGVVLNVNGAPGNVLYGPEEIPLAGKATLHDRIGDVEVELAPRSFFQVNRWIAARAYQDLRAAASDLGPIRRAVDAYAGAGGIALTLAPFATEVVAIEESAPAAEVAAAALRRARTERARAALGGGDDVVRFVNGDVADHLAAVGSADLVVLNPPRAGCADRVLEATAALRPRLVAYLSCHPGTLTRDITLLRQRGFVTTGVIPYDMLPHTPHVEALAFLAPAV
jgi:23S rRNA (uracil1939-C5)-methyltransferase